jgi:hypothetical protein
MPKAGHFLNDHWARLKDDGRFEVNSGKFPMLSIVGIRDFAGTICEALT